MNDDRKKRVIKEIVTGLVSLAVGGIVGVWGHDWSAFLFITLILWVLLSGSRHFNDRDQKYEKAVRSKFSETIISIRSDTSDFQDLKLFTVLTESGQTFQVYVDREFKATVKAN